MANERIQRVIALSGELATAVRQSELFALDTQPKIDDLMAAITILNDSLIADSARLTATQNRVDAELAALYAPITTEAINETVAPEAKTESGEPAEVKTAEDALSGAAEQVRERFPCSACGDTFYKQEWLDNHICTSDGPTLGTALAAALLSEKADPVPGLEADPLATCINLECKDYDASEPNGCGCNDHVYECDQVTLEGVSEEPRDTYREDHAKLVAERLAAGDDINDSGVFFNPEISHILFPAKTKRSAEIRIAANADGLFRYGYNFKVKDGGYSGPASLRSPVYETRKDAILGALAFLKKCWPEVYKGKGLKPVADAIEDFENSILATVYEAPKQEVAQPVVQEKAALTPLQEKCKIHLKPNPMFITQTADGPMCKACKLILPSGGGARGYLPFELIPEEGL